MNKAETRLLTIPDAADALGMSQRWMWDRLLAGDIPVVCLGRRRLIRPADLEAFVASRVETKEPTRS
jgi:predicted DNA-binding transcriptional regulator AlpA